MDRVPFSTSILCFLTVVTSMCVAYLVSGNVFGSIKITDLESYGGFTSEHIKNFELWRLFVAQIIHSKQLHMVYNVLALLALGFLLEKRIGYLWFVSTWFVSGALGTLYSTLFVVAPWNIGTGGSQAIFGLCGLGFVLLHKFESKLLLTIGLFFAIFPALALDLIFAGYPKPGHMCGFTIGLLMGLVFMVSRKGKEIKLIG